MLRSDYNLWICGIVDLAYLELITLVGLGVRSELLEQQAANSMTSIMISGVCLWSRWCVTVLSHCLISERSSQWTIIGLAVVVERVLCVLAVVQSRLWVELLWQVDALELGQVCAWVVRVLTQTSGGGSMLLQCRLAVVEVWATWPTTNITASR